MNTRLIPLFPALLLSLVLGHSSSAASVGDLLKLSCPADAGADHPCRAVYYLGIDGKRHAFPNADVYFSWHDDFSSVRSVDDETLAAWPLGRNVTYRPGTKLVKITSVPTVYAVDLQGTLQMLTWSKVQVVLVACVRPRSVGSGSVAVTTGPRHRPSGWGQERHAGASPIAEGLGLLGEVLMTNAHGLGYGVYGPGGFYDVRDGSYGVVTAAEPRSPKPQPPQVWLELFVLKPLMRLRIRQKAFNYDYLEDRLTTSSRRNFGFLIRDILKYAPDAAKVGHIGPALVGLPMDHPKKMVDEKDHELAVTALLTRESIVGLPRPGKGV